MTGLDVLRHIKKQSPDSAARLIMVSGNEPSSEERAEFQEVRSAPIGCRMIPHLPLAPLLTITMFRARTSRLALKHS